MLQVKRPLTRINLLESSREIVPIDSSINRANLFRKSKPSLALPATNLPPNRIRDSHISKLIIAQTKKGRREMYAVENIHLRNFFSLLLLQYLDYMSRKSLVQCFQKESISYSIRTRRTIAFYPDIIRPKSIVCVCVCAFSFAEI